MLYSGLLAILFRTLEISYIFVYTVYPESVIFYDWISLILSTTGMGRHPFFSKKFSSLMDTFSSSGIIPIYKSYPWYWSNECILVFYSCFTMLEISPRTYGIEVLYTVESFFELSFFFGRRLSFPTLPSFNLCWIDSKLRLLRLLRNFSILAYSTWFLFNGDLDASLSSLLLLTLGIVWTMKLRNILMLILASIISADIVL